MKAKGRWGGLRVLNIKELVFTGYEGFADEDERKSELKRAEKVSLVVKFLAIDELDQTFLTRSH